VVLVLKGAGTLVASPDGRLYRNETGNPGMAKGGSGDVLAGMIASFAAQGIAPYQAAVGAVYLHGLAGDRCSAKYSQSAMLPTDLIGMLPELFREIGR
jgi:NAD(P)H-hydrate epimerase